MVNCGKCDAQLADDAKFCPQCGERVDGLKECRYCRREIAEDAVYCTYCGKRQDGKVVCNKCGEVYEGNFCPKCGTAVRPQAAMPGYSPAPAAMNASAAPAASVFSGISFGVSIAYLVMSVVLCNDSVTPAKIGASAGCVLIFTAFTLVMSIVNACLLRKKNDAPVYEEYTG